MAQYLVIKNGNDTKSYECKTTHSATPYLRVKNSYLDLTTKTTTGLQLKIKNGNSTYRPRQVTTTDSSRSSEYTITTGYSGSSSRKETTGYEGWGGAYTSSRATYASKPGCYGPYWSMSVVITSTMGGTVGERMNSSSLGVSAGMETSWMHDWKDSSSSMSTTEKPGLIVQSVYSYSLSETYNYSSVINTRYAVTVPVPSATTYSSKYTYNLPLVTKYLTGASYYETTSSAIGRLSSTTALTGTSSRESWYTVTSEE